MKTTCEVARGRPELLRLVRWNCGGCTGMVVLGLLASLVQGALADDWPQDGGNAQRTACTPEEPGGPWKFAWAWNGPDSQGGAGRHHYHQPEPYIPFEARTCLGGGLIYAPAGEQGLFALRLADGTVAWHFQGGTCLATPVYDAASQVVCVGTSTGELIKLKAHSGQELGRWDAAGPLNKSLLLAGGDIYALTSQGVLHKVELSSLRHVWTYQSESTAQTLPAFSATHQAVVFVTADLQVHCVQAATGALRWKVPPAGTTPPEDAEFTGGWPVIAEQHGVVFLRMITPRIESVLWSGGGPRGQWPPTNAAIRQRLVEQPLLQNLFALNLKDGTCAFIPAVGPAGVEDLQEGQPRLRVHSFPVIKTVGPHEVAYLPFRSGDLRDPTWDGRWDSHIGEMVLDSDTVPGLVAGDLRFIEFEEHGGWSHVTDESCPLSVAGETLFQAHWDVSQSARITDRSVSRGLTRSHPITTSPHPPVVRHAKLATAEVDPLTHWSDKPLILMDRRYYGSPGFWTYANILDPPTPLRDAYSEGILPRFTYVAAGHVIVQGNGGELMVLRYHHP